MNKEPLDSPHLLPQDMKEWLPDDHLAYFLIDTVGALNLNTAIEISSIIPSPLMGEG